MTSTSITDSISCTYLYEFNGKISLYRYLCPLSLTVPPLTAFNVKKKIIANMPFKKSFKISSNNPKIECEVKTKQNKTKQTQWKKFTKKY